MPIHDWTRVDSGIFHDFHLAWIAAIRLSLNGGLLPRGYYALAEQVTGSLGPDVLTLRRPVFGSNPAEPSPTDGGIAVADAPPKARFHARVKVDPYASKAKVVVIRHRSRNQIIAMLEIVSPGNKSGQAELRSFVRTAEQALLAGIHLLIVDLFPPTVRDPQGIHRAIWGEGHPGDFALPDGKPLTCVSYLGFPSMEVYLNPVAVGGVLPDMPLFLSPQVYVSVPLEATYRAAWEGVPDFLQELLSAPAENGRRKPHRGRKTKE
jgi:hypothetical protein